MRNLAVCLAVCFAIGVLSCGVAAETMVWGEDRDMKTLDPRITQSRHELQVIRQIFDSLITLDAEGNAVPWLAESWDVAPDFTSVTFHLKPGITFHDGTPCDAEAFKFTFDSIADPELGSQAAIDYLGPYEGTEVLDALRFTVHYTRPYAAWKSAFCLSYLAPVSPTAIQEGGNAAFAANPVGTGPFKFEEWITRESITLVKNEAYAWAPETALHQGAPYIDELVFKIIPESLTRVGALETGEIDVADLLPPLDVQDLSGNPDFTVMLGRVAGIPLTMYLNTSRPPTNDINVRRAIMYGLDQAAIVENVYFGYLGPAYSLLAPTTPCYWEGAATYYEYSPEKARALLESAGWVDSDGDGIREKDGQPCAIFTPIGFKGDLMTAVQAELRKIGIDMVIENVTGSREVDLVMNNEYEVTLVRWVATDPVVLDIILDSTNISSPGYFKFNQHRVASDLIDQLLADAVVADTPEARCSVYELIQRIVLDQAWLVPLQETTQTVVHAADIEGLRFEIGNYQVVFYDARRVP